MTDHITMFGKVKLDRLAVNMLYGDEGSGKSTFCYHIMKVVAEEIGGKILYIDTEGGFDPGRMRSICGDNIYPEVKDITTWIQLTEYVKQLKRRQVEYDLIIIDSIGYLFRTGFLDAAPGNQLPVLKGLVNDLAHIYIRVRKGVEKKNGIGIFTNWTKSTIQTDNMVDEGRDFLGGRTAGFLSKNIYKFNLMKNSNNQGYIEVKKAKNIPKGTTWKFEFVSDGITLLES